MHARNVVSLDLWRDKHPGLFFANNTRTLDTFYLEEGIIVENFFNLPLIIFWVTLDSTVAMPRCKDGGNLAMSIT